MCICCVYRYINILCTSIQYTYECAVPAIQGSLSPLFSQINKMNSRKVENRSKEDDDDTYKQNRRRDEENE